MEERRGRKKVCFNERGPSVMGELVIIYVTSSVSVEASLNDGQVSHCVTSPSLSMEEGLWRSVSSSLCDFTTTFNGRGPLEMSKFIIV